MPPPAYSSPSPPRGLGVVGSKRPRSPLVSSSTKSKSQPHPPQQRASVQVQAPSPPPTAPATATALVYDGGHVRHAHPTRKHPERPERVEAVLSHLESRGLLARCRLLALGGEEAEADAAGGTAGGVVAPEAALAGVHSQHYLARLRRLERAPLDRLLEEAEGCDSVYLNEATVDCARRAAGALLALVGAVVKGRAEMEAEEKGEEQSPPVRNGLALIRPPGHHAEEHHARGFCVLNNVAVAAQHARQTLVRTYVRRCM